nr:radical SAM protein [Hyperthermus butylicus]
MAGKRRPRLLRSGKVVNAFDPWGSPLCTCPTKYSLNPYTGCSHFCVYCYATAYIGQRPSTPKKNYRERLLHDITSVIDPRFHIDISTSSDPYPPEEEYYKLTRWTLEQLLPRGFKVLIITKGSLVARDTDLLSRGNAAVTMTITTLDRGLAAKLEPGAPPPRERIEALRRLSRAGVPVGLRLDPVFPYLTDDAESIRRVLEAAYEAGVRFVVTSTYKARPDNLKRLVEAFPEYEKLYNKLYREEGVWMHGYWYLRQSLRYEIMLRVKREAERLGMEFATCREGFPWLHTARTCDGSHLIPLRIEPPRKPQQRRLDEYASGQERIA